MYETPEEIARTKAQIQLFKDALEIKQRDLEIKESEKALSLLDKDKHDYLKFE